MLEIPSLVLSTGILSAVLQVLIDRVVQFVKHRHHLFNGVDDNLRKLKRTLMSIQPRVDDLEKKHCVINEAAEDLLQDLQTSFLDAEDLLDKIGLGLERLTCLEVEANTWSQVPDLIPFYSSIPSEINRMQMRLDELVTELERYYSAEGIQLRQQTNVPYSTSLVDECCVFGRDKDKYKMKEMVLSVPEVANVSVIPIVGMGGIGKTTLAQIVYNDADVHKKFDLKMWVSVSSDYGLDMITKSILESATGGMVSQLSSLDSVQVELQKTLKGKRFLLVLDGICNENLGDWDQFRLSFGAAKKGSKIVMTTRTEISASIVASCTSYRLDPLCDNACWEIIKQRGNLDGGTNLEANGLAISKKCKGLPWVAKVIGSSLHSGEMDWDALLREECWELQEHKTQIYPGLKWLTYDDMPSYLKRCFSYCSIFPRDHVVEKDDLVQQWAAEGFIQSQGKTEIEDVGRQYFEDLRLRSFFSQVSDGDPQRYKMHELIHDLARFVSTNLCFSMEDNLPCLVHISPNARHASLLYESTQLSTLEAFYKWKKLRTFTFLPKVSSIPMPGMMLPKFPSNLGEVPYAFFERLRCLRVLNLSHSAISKLPESVGILIHLRYLNLSHTCIKVLPKSLTTICGLETLKLKSCPKLLHLPENLKDLIKLRHLDFDRHRQLSSMPRDIGKLSRLETLHAFRVGKEKGYQIEELKNMRCLRGSISVTNLENVADFFQAEAAMLHNKQYLDRLELEWNGIRGQMQPVHQEVLTALEPHAALKELRVSGYCGLLFPGWIANTAFSKLESIEIENCPFCELLPALGQLPALKKLLIQNLSTLKVVDHLSCGNSSAAFQSLETLTLCDMPELSNWSGLRVNDMPCLRDLSIDSCPMLATLPSFQYLTSLQCLDINRCPQLQSLPEGELPPSVKTLIILESDILKDRCKMGEGADWKKIRWIPTILIENMVIPPERPDDQSLQNFGTAVMRNSSKIESLPESQEILDSFQIVKDADEHETLPHHLKRLFLYCSLFPYGYEFSIDELVQLWMAEGFIRERQRERMEDTAIEYFNSLKKEGFFVCSRCDFAMDFDSVLWASANNPSNFLYKVNPIKHSLLEDTISSGIYFKAVDGKLDGASEMTRQLSLINEDIDGMDFGILRNFTHLRTLHVLSSHGSFTKQVPRDLCFTLTFLRTLNLSGTWISELPSSIGNVKSLRYVDASRTRIARLPESIGSLHNLQTIKLRDCTHFVELPKGMKKLTNLRHIDLDIIRQLDSMPAHLGNLTNLQTLSAFLVGRDDGCHVGELKSLNDLKGGLNISRLENVASKKEAEEAALIGKKRLHTLEFRWSDVLVEYAEQEEEILECLQPHSGLKVLHIHQYSGSVLPTWISNPAFADLVAITLYKCRNCKLLPCMGQLPALKSLSIIEMNEVKYIDHQFLRNGSGECAFPKLERLEVDVMLNLKEWKHIQVGDFPSLVKLIVDSCPELVRLAQLACLQSLKHLELRRCPKLLSLPSDGQLPHSLESFVLVDCLVLKEWCLKSKQWSMLCHISSIWFDHEEVGGEDSISRINEIIEGKADYPSAIKPRLDGSFGDGLKKLDSFNRWMSKELEDVDEPQMQSSSGAYWETVESENEVDESSVPLQVRLDSYMLGPSLSHDQLFSIVDFSPSWAYENSDIKVLITGRFLKSQHAESCKWSCMFGEVEVPAEVIADGVLRCYTPIHKAGRLPFYVTCSNRLACSEVREFEYRVAETQDVDCKDYYSDFSNETLIMRFGKLLSLSSTSPNCDPASITENSELNSKITSLLKNDNDEWDKMLQLTSDEDFSLKRVEEQPHQQLLKEKLHAWLLQKLAAGGKGPNVLDEGGQGVLHFGAALGYDWVLLPTITAGVSVNTRDVNGWTALHWAAFCGREHTVASLISLGAAPGALTDPTAKYPAGETPADLASEQGHKGIAGYLAESALSKHLESLNLDLKDGNSAEISGAKAAPSTSRDGELTDGLSLRDSLTDVCNATQAAVMRNSSKIESLPESQEFLDSFQIVKDADEHETLPHHLKRLFLYCSLFPFGYEFSKDELVHLWIAEGFIRERQRERMEDTATEHFNSLEKKGFFVFSRCDFTMDFVSLLSAPMDHPSNFLYKVNPSKHSLLEDTVSSGNYFKAVAGKLDGASQMTKHLSLIGEDIDGMAFGILRNFKHLRTLHMLSCRGSSMKHVPRELCFTLTYLKTLNLSGTSISELPSSIGNVKSLRYIDASHTPIARLPESIDSLHHLQTIKLRGCRHFVQLPKGMKKLSNLRHIDLNIIRQLDTMPGHLGNLTNLQTLPAFLVGRDHGCHVGELKNLNDLKGSFIISRLENVLSKEEAEEAALVDKKCIHRLELRWSDMSVEYAQQEKILECLQPHSGLKELQLQQYSGSILPAWISNPSFTDLVVITLYRCRNCKLLPCMGQLPALKSLSIIEVNEVEEINHQFLRNVSVDHAFPKLESLEIDIMRAVKEWKDIQMGDLPLLVKLTVDSCPELVTIPPISCLKSLKHLEFRRCPKLLSLPADGLPTGLESFIIVDCDELKEWCLKNEHWSMLCRVPSVWFDNEEGYDEKWSLDSSSRS